VELHGGLPKENLELRTRSKARLCPGPTSPEFVVGCELVTYLMIEEIDRSISVGRSYWWFGVYGGGVVVRRLREGERVWGGEAAGSYSGQRQISAQTLTSHVMVVCCPEKQQFYSDRERSV
jgi:hypothetical protein